MKKKKEKIVVFKVIQGDYGYGWSDLVDYNSEDENEMKEMARDFYSYKMNEPNVPHRIITRLDKVID